MKKLSIIFIGFTLFSCSGSNNKTDNENEKSIQTETTPKATPEAEVSSIDKDALIKKYKNNRTSIEDKIHDIKPLEIKAEFLREKIRQKWSKIHIYAENGAILRIKTYPYEAISDRTEEFYFYKGRLATVVMENDGDWTQSKKDSTLDKVFYFENGNLIHEDGENNPYETAEGIADELVQEAIEYVQIYNKALEAEEGK